MMKFFSPRILYSAVLCLGLVACSAEKSEVADSTSQVSAAATGDYEAGITAAQNGNFKTALAEFTAAAEQGLDLAQYNLGVLYYSGLGVKADHEKAYEWTKKAAEQGHLTAQFNLGTLYFNGHGTRRNREEAFQWYSVAAQQDHAEAQYNLATLYGDGTGVEKDLVKAHFWANVSRENEFDGAAELQQGIAALMTPEIKAQAEREFIEWLLAR
jgi:TPR repeat protein